MSDVPANPSMIDVLDTFWKYAVDRFNALNVVTIKPVKLMGMVNAMDWPQIEIEDGGIYLLYLHSIPLNEDGSRAQVYYEHFMQWNWIFMGQDIGSDQVGFNRASRFRDNLAVMEALRQMHFPGFSRKQFSSVDESTGAVTFTQYSDYEMIHWGNPRLLTRMDNAKSGLLYGSALFEVYGWSSVNPLVNV